MEWKFSLGSRRVNSKSYRSHFIITVSETLASNQKATGAKTSM
jgi:hypothetical protein